MVGAACCRLPRRHNPPCPQLATAVAALRSGPQGAPGQPLVATGGAGLIGRVPVLPCVQGAADMLRERFPAWTVAPYSAYADRRRQARAEAAAAAAATREAAAARRTSNKRPRVEMEAAAAPPKAAPPGAAALGARDSWRCTIM